MTECALQNLSGCVCSTLTQTINSCGKQCFKRSTLTSQIFCLVCSTKAKNTLHKFMTELTDNCNSSRMYTNHSKRVTAITVLMWMKFSSSEIMSVSGYKSIQLLTNYQHTQPKQKIDIRSVLYQSMTCSKYQIIVPGRGELPHSNAKPFEMPNKPSMPHTTAIDINPENALIPFKANFEEEGAIPDIDLMAILSEFESKNEKETSKMSNKFAVTSTNCSQ